jgi:signal transduction histidine kinase
MASAPLPDGATMFAFRDVTDSFHKQRMLTEQNEKLGEISSLKGQFLESIHGASHELKIPLNTIIGFSDLLRQEVRGKLNDRQHEFVDNISQASNELRQLIGGIIDLAMLESDFFEFCIEAIEVKPTLVSVTDFIRRNAGDGAQITLTCPDEIGTMPGDAPRFREVIHTLVNALRNEVAATDTLEIGVRHRPDHVAIWIGCRNSVIPLSIRDIFGRNNLSNSIPQLRRVELGITLVRQFVERQGGRIAIETGEGKTREAIVCHFLRDADAVRAAINHEREPVHPHAAE